MTRTRVAGIGLTLIGVVLGWAYAPASAQRPTAGATVNQPSEVDRQVEAQIRSIEEKERDALAHSDTGALEQYWDKELIVNAPGGHIRTGSEVLGFVKSGQLKYTSLERQIERIAVRGDLAIVMGAETVVLAAGADAGKTLHRRFTDVFERQGGQWRLIARQSSVMQ